jgi:hypothetical protein
VIGSLAPPRLDLIKMDVEGAEELVLRGAEQTLQRFRPLVAFEMTARGPARLGLEFDGAWRLLERNGYRFYDFVDDRLVPITSPASANALAVHSSYEGELPLA